LWLVILLKRENEGTQSNYKLFFAGSLSGGHLYILFDLLRKKQVVGQQDHTNPIFFGHLPFDGDRYAKHRHRHNATIDNS
jgi:hypothetical protein